MIGDVIQLSAEGQHRDDFNSLVAANYTVTKGTGGTLATNTTAGQAAGGWAKVPTGAILNDYQSISTLNPTAEFLAARPVAVEAKVLITEAAANSSSWYFGLTDTLTTGFLTTAGVPPASYHGAVIYKPQGSTNLYFQVANGSVKSTPIIVGTFVSGTALLLGITFDPADGVTGVFKAFINGMGDGATGIPLAPQTALLAGMAPMYLSAGVVASTTAAETLQLDYWVLQYYR